MKTVELSIDEIKKIIVAIQLQNTKILEAAETYPAHGAEMLKSYKFNRALETKLTKVIKEKAEV